MNDLISRLQSSSDLQTASQEVGVVAAVAREQSEIQAAVVSAKKFPRDEVKAVTRIFKSLERPTLAEGAAYSFPRGGKTVKGPSVELARELARCWGNIRCGNRIVSVDEDYIQIKGYAYDVENNTYHETEDKFRKLVQRKGRDGVTRWVEPDERDLRELVGRRGAIAERNAILKLIPSDIVDQALEKATQTLEMAASGKLQKNKDDVVRRLALAFDKLGVSTSMLEGYLGHELGIITGSELAELSSIFKSIADGNSRREEYFEVDNESKAAKDLGEKLKKKSADKPAEPTGAATQEGAAA